jgi:hypothetical protein
MHCSLLKRILIRINTLFVIHNVFQLVLLVDYLQKTTVRLFHLSVRNLKHVGISTWCCVVIIISVTHFHVKSNSWDQESPELPTDHYLQHIGHSSLLLDPLLRNSQWRSYSSTFQYFMESKGSLQCSQEPSTGPYRARSIQYIPSHTI